jgi:signal peptidase I
MSAEINKIEDVLLRDGTYASVTSGVSMEPLFRTHRDMVIFKRAEGEMKKYDVVLYRSSGNYVMHRIISVRAEDYVIRGDNTYTKEFVPKGDVIAVLVAFNRKGKRHEVSEVGYRFYSRLWHYLYPIRSLSRRVRLKIKRIFSKNK